MKYKDVFLFYTLTICLFQFFSRFEIEGFLGYYDELILIFIPLMFFAKEWRAKGIFFLVLCSFSLMNEGGVFTQFILDQKFLACLLFCSFFARNIDPETAGKVFLIIVVINVLVIILEVLFPNQYQYLLAGDYGAMYSIGGHQFYRVNGIFLHPGELAFFAGLSMLWFWLEYNKNRSSKNFMLFVCSLIMLLLTFQRAEILALILAFSFLIFVKNKYLINFSRTMYAAGLFFAFGCVFYLFLINVNASISYEEEARVALYKGAFTLFKDNLVNGIGPGLYGSMLWGGGEGAYYSIGIDKFWWFQKNRYITDSFWPKILAEYGSLGILAWLMLIIGIANFWTRKTPIPIAISIFLFIVSLQAPIYFNVKLILITMMFLYAQKNNVDIS